MSSHTYPIVRNAAGKRICNIEDCDLIHYARGLCSKHYASDRVTRRMDAGLLVATGLPRPTMRRAGKLCETGCGRPVHARGFCHSCYKKHAPRKPCSTEGCEGKLHAQGLCIQCYGRAFRLGRIGVVRPVNRPAVERFTERLAPPNAAGCVLWQGTIDIRSERGTFTPDGQPIQSHRYAYKLAHGSLPTENGKSLHLDHMCRVPLCANVEHLQPVVPVENNRRGRVAAGGRVITSQDTWFWVALNAWRHGADNFPASVVTVQEAS